MRRIAGTFVTLITAAGLGTSASGQAQNPPPRRQAPAAAPKAKAAGVMDAQVPNPVETAKLLAKWEMQSARLKSLDVGFTRIDTSPGMNQQEEYQGRAYLQAPNLACLHFQEVVRADKQQPKLVDHERIVCTGSQVRQYDYKTKQIFVFPLDKKQPVKAIQQGPLPFLFNMKADEAKERYSMSVLKENDDAYLVGVVPRLAADKEVFSRAFLQLSKKTFLPDRLLLVSPNGKDTQDYKFSGVAANGEINASFFKGADIKGWKVIENLGQDPVIGGQPGTNPRGNGAGQPAQGRAQVGNRQPGTTPRNQ